MLDALDSAGQDVVTASGGREGEEEEEQGAARSSSVSAGGRKGGERGGGDVEALEGKESAGRQGVSADEGERLGAQSNTTSQAAAAAVTNHGLPRVLLMEDGVTPAGTALIAFFRELSRLDCARLPGSLPGRPLAVPDPVKPGRYCVALDGQGSIQESSLGDSQAATSKPSSSSSPSPALEKLRGCCLQALHLLLRSRRPSALLSGIVRHVVLRVGTRLAAQFRRKEAFWALRLRAMVGWSAYVVLAYGRPRGMALAAAEDGDGDDAVAGNTLGQSLEASAKGEGGRGAGERKAEGKRKGGKERLPLYMEVWGEPRAVLQVERFVREEGGEGGEDWMVRAAGKSRPRFVEGSTMLLFEGAGSDEEKVRGGKGQG